MGNRRATGSDDRVELATFLADRGDRAPQGLPRTKQNFVGLDRDPRRPALIGENGAERVQVIDAGHPGDGGRRSVGQLNPVRKFRRHDPRR